MSTSICAARPALQPERKWEEASRSEALAALASYLYSGVTTVFDAGNRKELILPLRAEERAGKILAPRIFATGNAITYPGSHGDRISIGISDFEKDKALLDAHIAEQQPDMVKLMMDEEGWGSRPMITLLHCRSRREDRPLLQPARHPHDRTYIQ